MPVNEAQRRARAEAVNAPTIEADTEETTAVSALPSGMAEVLRQTSGLSPRSDAPAAAKATPGARTGDSPQDEATVVSPSRFASNNEPTVVSMSMLAADDPSLVTRAPPSETILTVARGRNRRLHPFAALAGLLLLVVGAAVALRGGARPTGETARAPQPPSPVPGAPASLPTPMPVRERPASTREATAALHEPSAPTTETPALDRAAASGEATAPGRPLPRGRARAAAPLKSAAPTGTDPAEARTAATLCRLTIGSYPWSDLWIDGANTGQQTPVVGLPVTCGPHRLELKRRDLKVDQEENVTVNEGREFKREYELQGAALDE